MLELLGHRLLHLRCPSPSPGREQNSTKAQQVFAEVAKTIGEYPVEFRGAQVLTGSEEGSFGWISVNFLLETLIKVRAGSGLRGVSPAGCAGTPMPGPAA